MIQKKILEKYFKNYFNEQESNIPKTMAKTQVFV
jgi:hypothetical protein